MLTSPVIAVTLLTLRQMDATSHRAALAISSAVLLALQSKRPLIELASVILVTMRLRSWPVPPVTREERGYHGGDKYRDRDRGITTRRSLLPVARLATTANGHLAAMTSLCASGATRVRHGTSE